MEEQIRLRSVLVEQLSGNHAHVGFDRAVEGLPFKDIGITPRGIPHTVWELVEHIRITQYDILEFSRNPDYESPAWPDGYWPTSKKPARKKEWDQAVKTVQEDQSAVIEMIQDSQNDLLKPFGHGQGQTLLRESILIIDHNAYHIGQIVQIRRLLGNW